MATFRSSLSSRISRLSASTLLVVEEQKGADGNGSVLSFTILDAATGLQTLAHIPLSLPALSSTVLALPGANGSLGLVWLRAGVVWTLVLDAASRNEPQALEQPDSVFAHILDVGLLEQGVFVAQREDGSAVVYGRAEGRLDKLWDFSDVVSGLLPL